MNAQELVTGFLKAAKSAPDRELRTLINTLQKDIDGLADSKHVPGQMQKRVIAMAKEKRTGKRPGITMKMTKIK